MNTHPPHPLKTIVIVGGGFAGTTLASALEGRVPAGWQVVLLSEEKQRRALGHFVVIGGGFSGVEVAGAVADFIASARRHYRRVKAHELQVTLLHDMDHLLPELPARLGEVAARSLRQRGVDVRLGARAAAVDAHGVDLVDGSRLAADTVVCTIGARSNPLVDELAMATLRGRIVTEPDGQVAGRPGLWALGDCAATVNAANGQSSPPTAQFAVAQAHQMARNLVAHIEGRATRAFHHRSKGMMATTGHHKGVAQLLGVPLTGLPAWLVWRAYYLSRMPTLGRKVRIWVEWTWSLFFPVDITHLRFTRSAEIDATFAVPAPATPIHHPQT